MRITETTVARVSSMPECGEVVVQPRHKKMHLSHSRKVPMGFSLPAKNSAMRFCANGQSDGHALAGGSSVVSTPWPHSRRERSLVALRAFFNASQPPEAKAEGIEPSIAARKTINAGQIDLVELIEQIERPDGLSPALLDGRRRELLECMRAIAGEAYTEDFRGVAPIGQLKLCADRCTPALKIWEGRPGGSTSMVVLGFAGTRMTDGADLLCDLRGQIPELHGNPLHDSLPPLGQVGAGWKERWYDEATKLRGGQQLARILADYSDAANRDGKTLSLSVVGHSLGAVVAALAGFDIAMFLRHRGTQGCVSVYSFNPPRLGPKGTAQAYRRILEGERLEKGTLGFTLLQFTRELDPIQSLPFFMEHPDWASSQRHRHTVHRSANVHIRSHYDGVTDRLNLGVNHDLALWKEAIATGITPLALSELFGDPPNSPASRGDPCISRRELLGFVVRKIVGGGSRDLREG